MVNIGSIEVGTANAKAMAACTLDLADPRGVGLEVDGLLGLNFLREYHVTVDFRQALKLED